ncbi:beta-N-acetylglucosaminidase [Salsuginibacillus halophilus]|uniref:Beta-N-acetylglucosaminidase n=1 Tax=Salsuginibacillus halophilus TaxID=517424 RepID=A0A2P8HQM6_9BACI|nr:S-layer homology domain-containing protein [Salsuginibacillus halophilus]PSL48484.1 beta-N-acetylglucosaminidase [Salsuginibacillus halophilus]
MKILKRLNGFHWSAALIAAALAGGAAHAGAATNGELTDHETLADVDVAEAFSDVNEGAYYERPVHVMAEAGMIAGTGENTFTPDRALTRGEAATLFSRALAWSGGEDVPFPDVEEGKFYYEAVGEAVARDVISGYPDGTFQPDNDITRAEMALVMERAFDLPVAEEAHDFADVDGHFAEEAIASLQEAGFTEGYEDGTYRPEEDVSRAEFAVFLSRSTEVQERLVEVLVPDFGLEGLEPAENIAPHDELKLKFNAPVAEESAADGVELTDAAGNSIAVNVSQQDDRTLTLQPVVELDPETTYDVTVTADVTARDGREAEEETLSFTTIQPSFEVAEVLPEEHSDVAVDTSWTIHFDEVLDPETDVSQWATIEDHEGNAHDVDVQPHATEADAVEVTPLTFYDSDSEYELVIAEDAKSADGITLEEEVRIPFMTEADTSFEVASLQNGEWQTVAEYDSYNDALYAASGDQVVRYADEVLWTESGVAQTNSGGIVNVFSSAEMRAGESITYIEPQTHMEILAVHEDAVEVAISGAQGYVAHADITLLPESLDPDRSYYENVDGELYHRVARNYGYESYRYGPAPDFLAEGETAESLDGISFEEGTYEHPYTFKDMKEPTEFDEEDFEEMFEEHRPDARLREAIPYFFKAEEEHGVNAQYVLAVAAHESSWGESDIARDKDNYFGIGAVDGDAYEAANEYEDMETGIIEGAAFIKEYFNENDWRYNGPFPGNKGEGMNVNYASDPFWGQKNAGYMYRLSESIGEE